MLRPSSTLSPQSRTTGTSPIERVFRGAACVALLALSTLKFSTLPVRAESEPAAVTPAAAADRALNAYARAWAGMTGYTATVTAFEQKGTQSERCTLSYTFKKPANVAVHIISGPNAGSNLTWDGGPTVTGSPGSGLLSFLKKKFPLHDPAVTTTRGSSIDEMSFGSILAHAEHQTGTLTDGPAEDIAGVSADVVALTPADPAADGGLTREVIELSSVTHLPLRILGFVGTLEVRRIDFTNVTISD